jgi:ubiquinone/menaquinone biosynthesis C-methylase UbiE
MISPPSAKLYDREAGRYDRMQQGRLARWLLRDGREKAARHAKGSLLEVGIGSGATLGLYESDVEVTGIDISPAMLVVCRSNSDLS